MTLFARRLAQIAMITTAPTALLLGAPAMAQAQAKTFDIPAQPLAAAILEFSRQSDVMVVVSPDLAAGKRSRAVRGAMPSNVAIGTLLRGSGLRAVPNPSGGYRIEGPHSAPTVADANDAGDALAEQDIVVTGRTFLAVDTSGATNLPIALEKVPQSITVVSEAFIKAANIKTLGDIADYTAGAINSGNMLGQATGISLRGFNGGRAVDGLRVAGGSFEPDNAIIDRLEIVKGPSSVVYGVATPGGLVNYVTKSANRTTPSYIYGQVGAWNTYRIEGQAAGALNAARTVRLIGVAAYEQGDAYIHTLNHDNVTLYAGLDVDLTSRLSASLHGGYQRQTRTAFDGIPTFADGSPAPLPDNFFIGSKDMELRTAVYHAEGNVSWKATDLLSVSLKANYERAHSDAITPYAFGLEDDGTVLLSLQTFDNVVKSRSVGLFANYALDALGLDDSFVAVSGISQRTTTDNATNYGGAATANIFDGEAALASAFEGLRGDLFLYQTLQHDKVDTVAAQALIKPAAPLGILLGASYSKAKADVTVVGSPTDTFDFKGVFSFRGGLTYEPVAGLNTYVSFSQSFNPQNARDINQVPLKPLEGDQYEAGVKYRTGKALLTGSVYRILQKNQRVYDQSTELGDFYKTLGKVRHQGVEVDATGSLLPGLQLNASYTYLQTRIVEDVNPANIGKSEPFKPKHTASLYTAYTLENGFARGASAGGGFRYVGAVETSFDGSPNDGETRDLPSRFLVDANIGYTTGDWILQLNARNIFNKHYYINNYSALYFGNVVGDGANLSFSVQRKF